MLSLSRWISPQINTELYLAANFKNTPEKSVNPVNGGEKIKHPWSHGPDSQLVILCILNTFRLVLCIHYYFFFWTCRENALFIQGSSPPNQPSFCEWHSILRQLVSS